MPRRILYKREGSFQSSFAGVTSCLATKLLGNERVCRRSFEKYDKKEEHDDDGNRTNC
jgi:hypothetical protein